MNDSVFCIRFIFTIWSNSEMLGATSFVKIGEVWLSGEIGGVGEISKKKQNFIITIRYKIPTFSSVGPFFKDGIFSI